LGWTILLIGIVVIFYTVMGGTKAVSVTQKQQMIVILTGMVIAGVIVVNKLPEGIDFGNAIGIAGELGKLEVVDFKFDLNDRYNLWSALLGGTFLFLSYFGTDQSQVQRYLSGKSLTESRLGLLFNGIFKVPMQFMILFIGIMVFIFFLFVAPPLHFNKANLDRIEASAEYAPKLKAYEQGYAYVNLRADDISHAMVAAMDAEETAAISSNGDKLSMAINARKFLAGRVDKMIEAEAKSRGEEAIVEDRDYVFITFVINYLPIGLVGLLLAVIFSAAMSSTSSELSALATTSMIDIYKRSFVPDREDQHYFTTSKVLTIAWGCVALAFAAFANLFDNLIQAVNIIGSLFYGVILGVFAVAFFLKSIGGRAVLIAALVAQVFVAATFIADAYEVIDLAYLWLNLIGCMLTVLLALALQPLVGKSRGTTSSA
ncbi:MAG: sodium:solute symporter, partial [Bacteroidota bacterium]